MPLLHHVLPLLKAALRGRVRVRLQGVDLVAIHMCPEKLIIRGRTDGRAYFGFCEILACVCVCFPLHVFDVVTRSDEGTRAVLPGQRFFPGS